MAPKAHRDRAAAAPRTMGRTPFETPPPPPPLPEKGRFEPVIAVFKVSVDTAVVMDAVSECTRR